MAGSGEEILTELGEHCARDFENQQKDKNDKIRGKSAEGNQKVER